MDLNISSISGKLLRTFPENGFLFLIREKFAGNRRSRLVDASEFRFPSGIGGNVLVSEVVEAALFDMCNLHYSFIGIEPTRNSTLIDI